MSEDQKPGEATKAKKGFNLKKKFERGTDAVAGRGADLVVVGQVLDPTPAGSVKAALGVQDAFFKANLNNSEDFLQEVGRGAVSALSLQSRRRGATSEHWSEISQGISAGTSYQGKLPKDASPTTVLFFEMTRHAHLLGGSMAMVAKGLNEGQKAIAESGEVVVDRSKVKAPSSTERGSGFALTKFPLLSKAAVATRKTSSSVSDALVSKPRVEIPTRVGLVAVAIGAELVGLYAPELKGFLSDPGGVVQQAIAEGVLGELISSGIGHYVKDVLLEQVSQLPFYDTVNPIIQAGQSRFDAFAVSSPGKFIFEDAMPVIHAVPATALACIAVWGHGSKISAAKAALAASQRPRRVLPRRGSDSGQDATEHLAGLIVMDEFGSCASKAVEAAALAGIRGEDPSGRALQPGSPEATAYERAKVFHKHLIRTSAYDRTLLAAMEKVLVRRSERTEEERKRIRDFVTTSGIPEPDHVMALAEEEYLEALSDLQAANLAPSALADVGECDPVEPENTSPRAPTRGATPNLGGAYHVSGNPIDIYTTIVTLKGELEDALPQIQQLVSNLQSALEAAQNSGWSDEAAISSFQAVQGVINSLSVQPSTQAVINYLNDKAEHYQAYLNG